MRFSEALGMRVGGALAPLAALGARLRRARLFHPDGIVLRAQVDVIDDEDGAVGDLARRLRGPALVRLSSAWWRGGKEWPDDLGCAVRFRTEPEPSAEPGPKDQDLLFATIRTPLTTLPAVLTTNVHDFLANDYYAVSPFVVPELGKVKFRLVSGGPSPAGSNRGERLRRAVEEGRARFRLEIRPAIPFAPWHSVVELHLIEVVDVDQAALRFSPFRTGRSIEPRGLIQAMRAWTYARGQSARPASSRG